MHLHPFVLSWHVDLGAAKVAAAAVTARSNYGAVVQRCEPKAAPARDGHLRISTREGLSRRIVDISPF